jgi:hypothetical protein
VEMILLSKILFIVMVTLTFEPNDPKINRVLPLPQGNHVAKFVKDPIYKTKVIVRKTTRLSKIIFFHMITLVLYIGFLPSLATWFPCGRGRTLFILGSLPLYRLIIYIDGCILWCTHFLFNITYHWIRR